MADSSFDIVSKIDQMELDNAFNQCDREIATRFDFKNTGAKIEKTGLKILLEADTEERVKAAVDVATLPYPGFPTDLQPLVIALNAIADGTSLVTENVKKIAKFLKDSGPKSIKTQIQGEELRVSSKSRDDLQTAIAQVKKESWDFAVQFTNYR
jgi:uncharacterized protein YajQ (UPF0234 family)